jgi:hypothetical protein
MATRSSALLGSSARYGGSDRMKPNPAFNRTRRSAQFFLADVGGGGPVNSAR